VRSQLKATRERMDADADALKTQICTLEASIQARKDHCKVLQVSS
jgi:hypothetical protein